MYQTIRGCIGKCTFCNGQIIDKGVYRSLSKENIIKQLTFLYEKYKPKKIGIYDAMFGGNIASYKAVCDFFKKHNIPWGFESRIDVMTEEKLKYLRGTHCKYILYGLESVDLHTLKINRKIPCTASEDYYDRAVKLFKKTREMKVRSEVSILYGLPGNKKDILEKTVNFIKDNNLDTRDYIRFIFYIPIVYPGTDIWDITEEKYKCYEWDKFFINDENVIREGKIVYRNPDVSLEDMDNFLANSHTLIYGANRNKFFKRLKIRIKKFLALKSEGLGECNSLLNLQWFLLSVKYHCK